MKVFIVFLAFVLIFSIGFVYSQDMATLKILLVELKSIAEETASTCLLAAYEEGTPFLEENAAIIENAASQMAEKYKSLNKFSSVGELVITAAAISQSAVRATATMTLTNPLFSIFDCLALVTRSSTYELVE